MRSWLPVLIAAVLCGQVSAQVVQNYDLRAITRTDGVIPVGDGSKFVGESGATARTSLGLAIGTDVQAYDADLSAIGGLAVTDGNIIVGNGTTWVAESGATARTSLGLGTIATQAASSVAITGGTIDGTTIGGATPAAGAFTTLTTAGDVGIGTTATNRLTVDYSNNSAATAGIKLNSSYPTAGQTLIGLYIRDALKGKMRADSLGNLAFESQGGTIDYNYLGGGTGVAFWNGAAGLLVKFKQTGEVGLGVSNPTSKLEIGADNAKLALGAAGATDSYLQWTGSNLEVYSAGMVDIAAPLSITPGSSVTPANNGDVTFELTSDTTFTVEAKGSDGTVRAFDLPLTSTPANGDVLIYNSGWTRLAKGASGTVLKMGASLPAWGADIDTDTLGSLTPTDGNFAVGNGTAWVAESGATARSSLGLGTALVVEGDSLSACEPEGAVDWPDLVSDYSWVLARATTSNHAVAGQTADTMVGQYATEAHVESPGELEAYSLRGIFALLAGTNDIEQEITAAAIYADLKALWAAARADRYEVIAFTVPPSTAFTTGNGKETVRLALNASIKGDRSLYDHLCDAAALLPDASNATYYGDGTHFTAAGSGVVAAEVARLVGPNGWDVDWEATGATKTSRVADSLTLDDAGDTYFWWKTLSANKYFQRLDDATGRFDMYSYGKLGGDGYVYNFYPATALWKFGTGVAVETTGSVSILADNAKLALGAAGTTDSYLQWNGTALDVYAAGMVDIAAPLSITPGSSVTPANNGDVTFELTNNTTLTVKAKGSDGTVRTVALTLAP